MQTDIEPKAALTPGNSKNNSARVEDKQSSHILSLRNLNRQFTVKQGGWFKSSQRIISAVTDVNLDIGTNETVALVGESGSGKTTLSRLLLMLDQPSSGEIFYRGKDLSSLNAQDKALFRREVQPVFQNPYASLNPRMRVKHIVTEPLLVSAKRTNESLTKSEVDARLAWALEVTGMRVEDGEKYPHQFSGGQRQRIAIARAVACRPKLIVLDEPVSSQDISIQAQILNLLKDLQDELGMSYLFIAHDLATVRFMSDRLAVMYHGRIVEDGNSEKVFANPQHPYTQALFQANLPEQPVLGRNAENNGAQLDPTSISDRDKAVVSVTDTMSVGCHYIDRCPSRMDVCSRSRPELIGQTKEHQVACFITQQSHEEVVNG
ncbi:oligopeptide/dipeptide ABC transporter ATP-binding protein [Aurantivibrio plasticivorans]